MKTVAVKGLEELKREMSRLNVCGRPAAVSQRRDEWRQVVAARRSSCRFRRS
jgi:hypothetical protein